MGPLLMASLRPLIRPHLALIRQPAMVTSAKTALGRCVWLRETITILSVQEKTFSFVVSAWFSLSFVTYNTYIQKSLSSCGRPGEDLFLSQTYFLSSTSGREAVSLKAF